jgi:23S rRNA U2552 (ribose-2'-O)-methylase RlmE/FtsJ
MNEDTDMNQDLNLLQQVKEYAMNNYEKGWDVIVEAYTDKELQEAMTGMKTLFDVVEDFETKGPVYWWNHQRMETRFGDEW